MSKKTYRFLISMFVAGVLVAAFLDIHGLEAISGYSPFRNLPPEIGLANEVGIISLSPSQIPTLRNSTSRKIFAQLLITTTRLLGHCDSEDPQLLEDLAILKAVKSEKKLNRKQVIEALGRWMISLRDGGHISFSSSNFKGFPDYTCPDKISEAIGFLREKHVVRGYQDGSFRPEKTISVKESVMLVYRAYEQLVLWRNRGSDAGKTYFVDLPLGHFITEKVQYIASMGAFEWVDLGPSFDGNRFINIETMSALVGGILKTAFKSERISEIQTLFSGIEHSRRLTRGKLAQLMEIVIRVFGAQEKMGVMVSYTDIPVSSSLNSACQALAEVGIQVGYANGRMGPEEPVTRFEAISLIEAVLRRIQISLPGAADVPVENPHAYPKKSDLEDFANLIREKQKRIRQLLSRKPNGKEIY